MRSATLKDLLKWNWDSLKLRWNEKRGFTKQMVQRVESVNFALKQLGWKGTAELHQSSLRLGTNVVSKFEWGTLTLLCNKADITNIKYVTGMNWVRQKPNHPYTYLSTLPRIEPTTVDWKLRYKNNLRPKKWTPKTQIYQNKAVWPGSLVKISPKLEP